MTSGFSLPPPSYNPQQISEESTVSNAASVFGFRKTRSHCVRPRNAESSCTIPAVINSEQIPRVAQHLQLQLPKKRQARNYFPDQANSLSAFIKASESFTTDSYLGEIRGFLCWNTRPESPAPFWGTQTTTYLQKRKPSESAAKQSGQYCRGEFPC